MYLLYLDEFGHSGKFDPNDPKYQHSPIFGIGGFVVQNDKWKDLDRRYLRLKAKYFGREIGQSGERAERWELKGNKISQPSNRNNRRNKRFARDVLHLLDSLGCILIAKGKVKNPGEVKVEHLYTSTIQGIMRCERSKDV